MIVAINQFPTDTSAELSLLRALALESGAKHVSQTSALSHGSDGSLELADAVIDACAGPGSFQSLYSLEMPYKQKIEKIAIQTYGADGVDFHEGVAEQLDEFALRRLW